MQWQQFWQKRGLAQMALLPLSGLFLTVTALRKRFIRSQRAFCPVVVVGNINVGGAGKTPLVIGLGKLLASQGIRYAVISKGYGGSYSGHHIVEGSDCASLVGDEPLLIKLSCECPVVVAESRIEACRIVEEHFPDTQIILTDDGLQHYQLHRDLELCVINHKVGLGNRWVLPAGGLRETPSRLESVDFVVHNGDASKPYHYMLAERGWHNINRSEQRYPDEFSCNPDNNLALSGIAHPQLFFDRVSHMGIVARTRPLPDHYALQQQDLPADTTLLMTAKDWVKAKEYQHNDAWYLAVEAVLSQALKDDFLKAVCALLESQSDNRTE